MHRNRRPLLVARPLHVLPSRKKGSFPTILALQLLLLLASRILLPLARRRAAKASRLERLLMPVSQWIAIVVLVSRPSAKRRAHISVGMGRMIQRPMRPSRKSSRRFQSASIQCRMIQRLPRLALRMTRALTWTLEESTSERTLALAVLKKS